MIAERRLVEAFIETLGIHIPADLVERINSPIDCRELLAIRRALSQVSTFACRALFSSLRK